jgi:hypothetical protein
MEYAGYVPGNIIDWGAIGKSLNQNYKGVKQAWEARDTEAENLKQSGLKVIEDTDKASNKTLDTFVGTGASTIREKLLQLSKDRDSGKIKHSEYKSKHNNIMSSWGSFASKIQGMDEILVEFNKRQQMGEDGSLQKGSILEGFLLENSMSLRDFNNKEVKLGEDGRVYIYDKNDPNNLVDASNLLNIENMFDNRLDLTTAVNDKVKPLGKFIEQTVKPGGREFRFEDITRSEDYQKAEIDMIYSIANPNNPRSITAVLIDNSSKPYIYYKTDAEKNNAAAQALSKEMALKEMSPNEQATFVESYIKDNLIQVALAADGSYQPVVTDKHIKEAHDIVRSQMRSQLNKVYEEQRGYQPSTSSSNKGDGSSNTGGPLYPKLYETWIKAGTKGNPGDPAASANTFNALAKGKFTFKWVKGGLQIIKGITSDDELDPFSSKKTGEVIAVVNSLDDLATYFYGTTDAKGVGPAVSTLEEEKKAFKNQSGGGGSKPPVKFN